MKVKKEFAQNKTKSSGVGPIVLDLSQFSNDKINKTLVFEGIIVGQVIINDDTFYLKMDDNAPTISISDFPLQKKLIIDVSNTVKIADIKNNTLENLTIYANNIVMNATLTRTKSINVKAKKGLLINGALTSDDMYFEATDFENTRIMHAKTSITIKADTIQKTGKLESNILILNIKKSLEMGEYDHIKTIESTLLIVKTASLKGDLQLGASFFCKVENLIISTTLKQIKDAYFDCKEIKVKKQGSIQFTTLKKSTKDLIREINAEKIVLQKGSHTQLDNVKLIAKAMDSKGVLQLDRCNLTLNNFNLEGSYSIKNSECIVENDVHLKGTKTSIINNVLFEAANFLFSRQNRCQSAEFISDNMEFAAHSTSTIIDSRFDVSNCMNAVEKSDSKWKKSHLFTNSAQFKGKALVEGCRVESEICITSDQTTLKDSTELEARLFWQDEGAVIDKCIIMAESTSLLKKTGIDKTKIVTNSLHYTSTGTLSNCNVSVTKSFSGSDAGNLTFTQSFLKTGQTYTQGILNFTNDSYHQTNYLQQSSGTCTINKSIVNNNGLHFSMETAGLSVQNRAKIKLQSAVFNGDSTWNMSELAATGSVLFCGRTTGDKVVISSQDSLHLAENDHLFTDSTLKSNKLVHVTSAFSLTGKSELACETFNVASTNTLIENSIINAHDLVVLDRFCAKKSTIILQATLKTFNGSSISIEDTATTAKEMSFMGTLEATRSALKASANIIFEHSSQSALHTVSLNAGNTISNKISAQISGANVETKSQHLANEGKIKISDLKANASSINNSGSVESDRSVLFKANQSLLNTGSMNINDLKIQASSLINAFGYIRSNKSSIIQAPFLINYMGDIQSSGSLSLDSLIHYNLFGTERAYDYTNRTVYNCNYGLVLPSLPNSITEPFTYSRAYSFVKMGVTQLIPDYNNLFSLASMAAPCLKNSGVFLYNFYRSKAKISDLAGMLYNSGTTAAEDFVNQFKINDSSDVLPVMMNVLSTGLSLAQFGNVVAGAYKEVSAINTQTLKTPSPDFIVTEFIKDLAVTTFGPSINTQSLYSNNGGLVFSANLTDSTYFKDINDGFKGGWNVAGNYNTCVNRGIFAGVNLVAKGVTYDNQGVFYSRQRASVLFSESFTNAQGACIDLTNFYMKTTEFTNAGTLNLNNGSMGATNYLQTQTGISHLTKTTAALKENATFNGEHTFSEQSNLMAKNVNLQGKGSINNSSVIAQDKLSQNGLHTAKEALLSAKEMSLNGIKTTDGSIITEALVIKNANMLGTEMTADEANLSDSTFTGRQANIASEVGVSSPSNTDIPAPRDTNTIAIKDTLITNNITFDGMNVSANTHSDCNGTYKKTHLSINEDFTSSSADFYASTLHATNLTLLGETTANQTQLLAKEKIVQEGYIRGEEAYLEGKNLSLDGANLKKSSLIADEKLAIKNALTENTGILGKEVDLRDSKFTSSHPTNEASGNEGTNIEQTQAAQNDGIGSNQIKAYESLYASNVEIEGQSIQAVKMEATGTTLKEAHVKIEKDFIASDLNTDKVHIETNTAKLGGAINMLDTSTKAIDYIAFVENSLIKTHNAEYESKNSIIHESQDHEQTGFLVFKSADVKTAQTSAIRSGADQANTFYLEADTANCKGALGLDNAHFNVKQLENAEDLIGQSGQYANQVFAETLTVQTDKIINIQNIKPRDCDINVIANAINVNTDYKSDKDVSFTATKGKVLINADVIGKIVTLVADKSNVELNGKTVLGTSYVHIEAKEDVLLRATEKTYKGKYDQEKDYTQANIIGGLGNEETGNAGIIIHASNKVIVDGSNVLAQGKAIVSGDKGVEIEARSHTRITKKSSKGERFLGVKHGKKKYERIETKLCTSTIGSAQNKVEVIASQGDVNGKGGDFKAKEGTDIYAENNIKLQGIKTQTQIRKEKSSCFGINSKKRKEKFEHMKLYDFVDDGGNTRLHANNGDIEGKDTRFQGKGNIQFIAPNGVANLSGSILNHSIKTSQRKFTISAPIVETAKRFISGDKEQLIKQTEPTLGHIDALFNAKTPLEIAASTCNTGVHGYNAMVSIQEGNYGQQLMQGAGLVPKVDFNLTQTKTSSHSQSGTGAGIRTQGDVAFLTRYEVNLEAMPIDANNLRIKTQRARMRGQALASSYYSQTQSVTVGVGPSGVTDASASASLQKMKMKRYENMQVNIKNKIEIDVQTLDMDAANMDCESIKVKIGTLKIQTRQDELTTQSLSANASTTGAVGVHQSQTHSRKVNKAAGINVRRDIGVDDIQVKETNLIGAAITSNGHNGFKPEKLITKTLKDFSHTEGFGLSGNAKDITNALNNNSDEGQPSRLTSVSVSHEKKVYQAKVQAVVYGTEGVCENLAGINPNLNTTSADGKKVTRNHSHNITVDIPVESIKSSVQKGLGFFDNVTKKTSNNPTIPKPVDSLRNETMPIDPIIEETTPAIIAPELEKPILSAQSDVLVQPELIQAFQPNTPIINVPVDNDNEVNDLVETQDEKGRKTGTFSPSPQEQTLAMKQGRNKQQLSNNDNGRYTTFEKELDISAQNSGVTGSVQLILLEGGDKQNGLFYKATVDPLNNQLIIEAGAGKQYCVNLYDKNVDLGSFGQSTFAIDACSVEALIGGKLEATPTSISAFAGVEVGIMGPSATGSYTTPCFTFRGFTLQVTAEGSAGVGIKGTASAGAIADVKKMKAKVVGRVGLFAGAGVEGTIIPEVGVDPQYTIDYEDSYREIIENDPIAIGILDKYKNREWVDIWEREYINDKRSKVQTNTQLRAWGW